MIPFNEPLILGDEGKYIERALRNKKLAGDGSFSLKCSQWLEKRLNCQKAMLVPSGTAALEAAAILAQIQEGDEVIMPSFTFVSTANAFVLRGAKIAFVDIRPDTMNINEKLIEKAISKKTKAIVAVHYGGVACEMDEIMRIAKKHKFLVIEDAAQAILSKYKGKFLGTIGDIGCISFHETKNITCGEGGVLILNRKSLIERGEIIREKGTDRSKFFRGEVDKYTWVDIGSSYLQSEINAAFLYAQLRMSFKITNWRLKLWKHYLDNLNVLEEKGLMELSKIPKQCTPNGHIFFIKCNGLAQRTQLINFLKRNGILSAFHYIPLHSSLAGKKFGRFEGKDNCTTEESEKILRLPMYYDLKISQVVQICKKIKKFYEK